MRGSKCKPVYPLIYLSSYTVSLHRLNHDLSTMFTSFPKHMIVPLHNALWQGKRGCGNNKNSLGTHVAITDLYPSLSLYLLQPVGQALIYALQIGLKEKFTDEVKTAWVTLYTVVQHLMTLGMNEGIDA